MVHPGGCDVALRDISPSRTAPHCYAGELVSASAIPLETSWLVLALWYDFSNKDHPARTTIRQYKSPIHERADVNLWFCCEPDNLYGEHDAVRVLDARGVSIGMIAVKTSDGEVVEALSGYFCLVSSSLHRASGPHCRVCLNSST
jgi:hypothetical protein